MAVSNEDERDTGEQSFEEQGHNEEPEPTNNDNIPLEPGMIVACYVPSYGEEEPQIGSILSIPDGTDEVLIEWMSGTYSEPWTVCKKRDKAGYTTWKESVPISMILFPIELSASCRISVTLKKKLQHAYSQVRDN